jgi:hypothetical protein
MGKFLDLTGQRFGMLVVTSRAENNQKNRVRWHVVCDCGNRALSLVKVCA